MPNFDFEELKEQTYKKAISKAKIEKTIKTKLQKDFEDAILARLDAIEAKLGI